MLTHTGETKLIIKTPTLVRLIIGAGLLCFATADSGATDTPDSMKPLVRNWKKQEPLPLPWGLFDVDMVSVTEGWAVAHPITGDHAYILHTTNGGKKWQRQGGLFSQLSGISFVDALHGVAVGNEFRYTVDGGTTWQPSNPVGGSFYDVDLVDQSTGYACGFGEVRKTTDAGLNWVSQPIPLFGNFVGIDFVSATTGWVVGAEGSVYKTTNGGTSWVRQRHDTSKFYTGVSFVSATEGWVCGNSTILHTTNGGTSWVTQPVPAGADAIEIRFVDAQNGWAAGGLRTILHTTNGGQTWSLQVGGGFVDPGNRYPFEGLDAVDTANAIAVGGGNSIYVTSNGGALWANRGSGSGTIPFRVARTDANHIWAANSNSEVLYSTNGGKKWDRSIIQVSLGCETCSNTADIAFLNNNEGWAVINGDFTTSSWVWHSLDGGKTWQTLNVTDTGPLSGLAIVDAQTLVAVSGFIDSIFRSTDGGITWMNIPHPPGGSWFGSVRFVPGTQIGWTVGEGGKILKSTNGGATWTLQRSALHSFNLIDVSFADVNNGWTVGGEELHTTNGGTTWVNQNTGVFASVSVYAISPTTAWIGGLRDLGRTTDSGATWTIEHASDTDWYCMTFLDADNGWAGGQDQTIDDVPGSIWKRSSSASAAIEKPTTAERTSLLIDSGVWQAPPSGSATEPDGTR
jgi:photosystem II stability/assembly factor-like uncharacterized protein